MYKINVGIAGCLGRMGQELVNETNKDKRIKFVGGYDLKNSKTDTNDIFQAGDKITGSNGAIARIIDGAYTGTSDRKSVV